jgi:hypothetical protein
MEFFRAGSGSSISSESGSNLDLGFLCFFDQNLQLLMSNLQEKPSAFKREDPALQKNEIYFIFLCLWVIFALLDSDTDPGTPMNPDPQHWNSFIFLCIQARNISAQFEERHEAKTVGEMKLFVERLPQMQVSCRIVNFLCSFVSSRLAKDFTCTRLYCKQYWGSGSRSIS